MLCTKEMDNLSYFIIINVLNLTAGNKTNIIKKRRKIFLGNFLSKILKILQ